MIFRHKAAMANLMVGDQLRSLFGRAPSGKVGAHVHVLSLQVGHPLPDGVPARLARVTDALRGRFGEQVWDEGSTVLCRESLSCPANSLQGVALCRRELQRPCAPATEHQLRITCLEFADGSVQLIGRAHRAFIGRQFLFQILMYLAGAQEPGSLQWDEVEQAPGERMGLDLDAFASCPPMGQWTSPGGGLGTATTEPASVQGSCDQLVLALTRVLRSFNQGQPCSVPLLIDRAARNGRTAAGGGGWQLLALDDELDAAAAAAAAKRSRRAAGAAVWLTDERLEALSRLWGMDHAFLVALAISEALPQNPPAIRGWEHQPFQLAPFPVTVLCEERAQAQWSIRIQYELGAINADCAASLQTCLVNVMVGMAGNPDLPVAALPLLSQAEQQATLMIGRSKGAQRLLAHCRLEQRVMQLARAHPLAPALSDQEGMLTYGELDRRTNQLARALTARGVARGERVGLCLGRSSHMLVAALAVLKAGGTYVPIDPDYPAERIAHIREDAQLRLYVYDQAHSAAQQDQTSVSLAELLSLSAGLPQAGAADPLLSIDDAAYMIYTSGSTGRPKGVLVSHRNVQALLGAVQQDFALNAEDVWSLFHSFSFDFSIWEGWGALLTGARVHIVPYEVSRNTEDFIDLVNQQGITVLSQTPSAFGQLMAFERHRPIGAHLRLVVFGGEALDTRSLLPWFNRHPESQCRLINMFGITETTVHVTAGEIRRIHAHTGSRSVGRPIDGWGVYVLGPDQSVLPPGVDGEIYVSGSGVALGYHNRPELNRQRFLPDLLGEGRMYRSGDRGRLLPNGELLHLGRLDNQIKLRGFRIELDEIRNVLLRCRGVQAAAAVFTQHDKADAATARIDAYLVMNEGSLREVWSQALQWLPQYMLPATIARVAAMPLTSNGKLDAQQLAGQVLEKCAVPGQDPPPAAALAGEGGSRGDSDIERNLVEIWSELFARPIGRDDNFFDIGGNSLFAIRLSSKLRERGLPALNLRDLYVHQTIGRLSSVLAQHGSRV